MSEAASSPDSESPLVFHNILYTGLLYDRTGECYLSVSRLGLHYQTALNMLANMFQLFIFSAFCFLYSCVADLFPLFSVSDVNFLKYGRAIAFIFQ